MKINQQTLYTVLSKKFGEDIKTAEYEKEMLQGGTVGDVWLIHGKATTDKETQHTYKLVLKIQDKWERYGDKESWRREYDLYNSELQEYFSDSFRWPKCYHLEMNSDETQSQIWMEYIDGVTGLQLKEEMYQKAAYELGKFQGKLYKEKPRFLDNIPNLSRPEFIKSYYQRYKSWPVVYDYIRSGECEIPKHLTSMLIEIDQNSDQLFEKIEQLPMVFCHRDFWVANIFAENEKIRLIDWDTTGWGYMGEDVASLIADESELDAMVSLYTRCVPAYLQGFSEYGDTGNIKDDLIWERIVLIFGYRIVEWYLDAESEKEKEFHIKTLQKIYEMKES